MASSGYTFIPPKSGFNPTGYSPGTINMSGTTRSTMPSPIPYDLPPMSRSRLGPPSAGYGYVGQLPSTSNPVSKSNRHHHKCSHNHTRQKSCSKNYRYAVEARGPTSHKSSKKTQWDSIFCAEGSPWCSGGGVSLCSAKRRRRREPKLEMFDDNLGRISVDSASDWDEFEANERVWGHRNGPRKERTADDLTVTFRDLLPCCASILDKCGCCSAQTPRKRGLLRSREIETGPKIETVCLECGNVLSQKDLPKSIAIDMVDRGHPGKTETLHAMLEDEEKKKNEMYEGYKEWDIAGGPNGYRGKGGSVPLPSFGEGPARLFKNKPGKEDPHRLVRGDGFVTDETGHITLPQFDETK